MRLEIDSIEIKDIQESSATSAKDGVLYLNLKELEAEILKDERIKSVDLTIVKPGDKARMVNIVDVVQPRCKVGVDNHDFPGFLGEMHTAGSGKTRSLLNTAIVVSNPCTNRVETAVLDSDGPMSGITPYSNMVNLSIAPYKVDGVEERDFENAVKIAGFKSAVFVARAAEGLAVKETEVFESEVAESVDPKLPRVALFYQNYSPQFDYMAVSDKIIYGAPVTNTFPTVYNPNEVLDGGFVGWNALKALDSYSIQNFGVVKELYKHHGKDLNFVGVISGPANTNLEGRMVSATMAANLAKNVLHADGVILVKILGGMPHADISSTGVAMERLGVKTCCTTTPLTATGTLADTILYNDIELDLIVISGAMFEKTTKIPFKAEKILGGTEKTKLYYPEPIPQYAGDEVIGLEQYNIAGCMDHTGSRKIIVEEY